MSKTHSKKELIERHWDDIGACGSCGWHDLFYSYDLTEEEIEQRLKDDGEVWLPCHNKDDDDPLSHRGITIRKGFFEGQS